MQLLQALEFFYGLCLLTPSTLFGLSPQPPAAATDDFTTHGATIFTNTSPSEHNAHITYLSGTILQGLKRGRDVPSVLKGFVKKDAKLSDHIQSIWLDGKTFWTKVSAPWWISLLKLTHARPIEYHNVRKEGFLASWRTYNFLLCHTVPFKQKCLAFCLNT